MGFFDELEDVVERVVCDFRDAGAEASALELASVGLGRGDLCSLAFGEDVGLDDRDEAGKRVWLCDGQLGQDLFVEGNALCAQRILELSVADAVAAGGGRDGADPLGAELALLGPPVAVRILHGLVQPAAGSTERVLGPSVVPLCLAEDSTVLGRSRLGTDWRTGGSGGGSTSYSGNIHSLCKTHSSPQHYHYASMSDEFDLS